MSYDPSMIGSTNLNPISPLDSTTVDPLLSEQSQTANGLPEGLSTSTQIKGGTLDAFKKMAPKVYNYMIQGIAWGICQQMKAMEDQRHQIYLDSQMHS